MSLNSFGWIYVIMTSADYGRCKVGRTVGNPLVRFKNLRTGDPNLAILLAYYIPGRVGKLSTIEKTLHQCIGPRMSFHDENFSEWFEECAENACSKIEIKFNEMGEDVWDHSVVGGDYVCRSYESDLETLYGPAPEIDPVTGLPTFF